MYASPTSTATTGARAAAAAAASAAARRSQCCPACIVGSFLDRDKQKLLGVIEAGFGDLAPFNSLVRDLFAAAQEETALPIVPMVV